MFTQYITHNTIPAQNLGSPAGPRLPAIMAMTMNTLGTTLHNTRSQLLSGETRPSWSTAHSFLPDLIHFSYELPPKRGSADWPTKGHLAGSFIGPVSLSIVNPILHFDDLE